MIVIKLNWLQTRFSFDFLFAIEFTSRLHVRRLTTYERESRMCAHLNVQRLNENKIERNECERRPLCVRCAARVRSITNIYIQFGVISDGQLENRL